MTGVYSGGLVYEYSQEDNGYGLVDISGNNVSPNADFTALKTQLAANMAPQGNGGYKPDGSASTCPASSNTFKLRDSGFSGEELPAIPSAASKYMKDGAGKAPGLSGPGSQQAGSGDNATKGTATPGSGSASVNPSTAASTGGSGAAKSSGSSAASAGAAPALMAKGDMSVYVLAGVVTVSTFLGAALL